MSLPQNETRNGEPHLESFKPFFHEWIVQQDHYLQELLTSSRNFINGDNEEEKLRPLINKVLEHYEYYYRNKTWSANLNIFSMLSPNWTSTLEDAFLWIGGWRPSMAFHLLYSKAGLQLETQFEDLVRGITNGDLGSISPSQLARVDELQRETIREEKEISEKMAKEQEKVADPSMVELSNLVTENVGENENGGESVESTLRPKKEGFEMTLERADDLRLRTLRRVIEILGPLQAVHFLIAAAELHLRLHEWGMRRDDENGGAHL
ncbi:protein DOG1-like 3 [Tasmannia lanceolata]|uniref:protein DOG1-like 3 n=1 Tax=Tasmannia lanceolata TaxID=3420 RepID=UPI004062C82D